LDSRVALADAIETGKEVFPIAMEYGQKHNKELAYAQRVCDELGLHYEVVKLDFMNDLIDSPLMNDEMEIPTIDGGPTTHGKTAVVANRNMIFISIAMAYAIKVGADSIYYAVHDSIHGMAADCKPPFLEAIRNVAWVANLERINIITPYANVYKSGVVKRGLELGVNFEDTWTCFEGKEKACGKCTACRERLEAFAGNDVEDPLSYI